MKGRACEDRQGGHNNFQHEEYQVQHRKQQTDSNLTRTVLQCVREVHFLWMGAPASG